MYHKKWCLKVQQPFYFIEILCILYIACKNFMKMRLKNLLNISKIISTYGIHEDIILILPFEVKN